MSHQSEQALENNLIKKLCANSYKQIILPDIDSIETNFRAQLELHNGVTFTDSEFKVIRNHLDGGSVFEKAKKLRDLFELKRDSGTVYIEFINMEEWCKNIFQVTNQITNRKGTYHNRYDVTILINGLPLVQIELKRRGLEMKEAFNQICRYKKDSFQVGLFNYIQLFIISNGINTKYFSNNNKMSGEQLFYWTKQDNTRISNLEEFAETFLERCHLAKMITRYIVLNNHHKSLMVLRPYQYYAAEAIVKRVEGNTNNGYVWHTTGSGKTLTSFKTAQLLTASEKVDKIIFVVDRKDLDYQTTKEFNHFSEGAVTGTEDTESLVKQLGSDHKLVITTIQKLTNAVKKDRHSKTMEKIRHKKVVFIFDECHRSQFGDMHKLITEYFDNHQCFGFTGTPIMAENASGGRTTKDLFFSCLHQYVIKDAIDDANVLGFSVEYFSTFKEKDGVEDPEVEAINTDEVWNAPDRINLVTDYIIANHAKKTFNKTFTAIFAVSGIPSLIQYYESLKTSDHDLKIATIFSFGVNEDPEESRDESSRDKLEQFMGDYNKMFGTNFSTKANEESGMRRSANDFNAYYIDVARRVKEKQIDLLIVVNMFLTGFDSPLLNTLYVDKKLRYHGLIQAFSRTNRLYNGQKKHGNIVCFRNLKKATDQAIRLYSDKDALETVLMKSFDEYLDQFNTLLSILETSYPTMESVDKLEGEEAKKGFIELFRNLLRIKTRLNSFAEFSFEKVALTEQQFEDYTSKYKDLYNDIKSKDEKDKVSILDDIDFEIELLRRDNINVDYILTLLSELDPKEASYEKDKEFILKTLESSIELHSKKELIRKFMEQALVEGGDVTGDFEIFMTQEKTNQINELAAQEYLNREKVIHLLDEFEFTGKIDEQILEQSFIEELGLIARRTKKKSLIGKIKDIIEKFSF